MKNLDQVYAILCSAVAERNGLDGKGGQVAVAKLLGCKSSYVCQMQSDQSAIRPGMKRKIIELFGNETVPCPVIGTAISLERCRLNRERPSTANPVRVELARTCPRCEHNGGKS